MSESDNESEKSSIEIPLEETGSILIPEQQGIDPATSITLEMPVEPEPIAASPNTVQEPNADLDFTSAQAPTFNESDFEPLSSGQTGIIVPDGPHFNSDTPSETTSTQSSIAQPDSAMTDTAFFGSEQTSPTLNLSTFEAPIDQSPPIVFPAISQADSKEEPQEESGRVILAPPPGPEKTSLESTQSPEAKPVGEPKTEVFRQYIPRATMNDEINDLAQQASPTKENVPAAFPFSLMIEGPLTDYEKNKLIDLLEQHNMGIRKVDLDPQFENHKILIPRISEYAGVILVQALRGTTAKLRLGPSDTIFSTDETRTSPEEESFQDTMTPQTIKRHQRRGIRETSSIKVTQLPFLDETTQVQVIDIVTASANLKSTQLEPEKTREYQELIERLTEELKQKAKIRGANAILNFTVQLTLTSSPLQYKVMVIGSAVKAAFTPSN